MIAATKDVFLDQITDRADRTLLTPRSFFRVRKVTSARYDEKTIPIVHVDIVHRIPKRPEDRRFRREWGVENATGLGNRIKLRRCARAQAAVVERQLQGFGASCAHFVRHGGAAPQ